ncbi:hypothetical protein GCM10011579_051380 [Streptomyces albiflavescens]|uniref:Novel STAND NTPase 3 domain-containing protein n=1 Tax=Streptomyces albiflavescens TaxID=1623582 RepID=A0A917Y7Y7_9ACTN|nr:DUF2379 family protein [Streptomyces albiflavescens]GGN73326.1 hypothetical protein GCM10011579_051380 [Streptomyces albiflavescens]
MSEETLPEAAAHKAGPPGAEPAAPPESARSTVDGDGPVSESDALQSLADGGGPDASERSEAIRAGAIADMIAERLNSDTVGTRIGTLALFNETVSFGGGFHTGGVRTPARPIGGTGTVPLDDTELAEHTELYVHPDGYDEALEALRERHVLVLTGPPGSGRTAAAVNLLSEALALNGTTGGGCHRVLDVAGITAPDWEPPAKHSGCLAVLDDGPAGVAELGTAGLRGLAGAVTRLRTAQSHLVIVGGHDLDVLASAPGAETVARHSLAALDPVAVVERRVLGHGADPELRDELRAMLEATGAVAALRERPSASHATGLASVVTADGDLAAAVARLRDPSEQVHAWFHVHREPEAISFALAVAVLEDSGYLTVTDAAMALHRALAPETVAPPDIRFRDRIGHEQPWIETVFAEEGGTPGPPRVRFRSSLLRQVVLAYAWTTLDGRRDAVLGWLRRLLGHADLEVRARAAVAAGLLARTDHHYAVHRFLKSWAGSTSWPVRQAAATALGVAGAAPDATEQVWELLHEWARGGTSAHERRLAATAANAVGGLLGRDTPDRALNVLRTALDRGDDWGTLTPVAWGGVHLLHQGRVSEVLDAYLDWSRPRDMSPMVAKTLSAFVFAVSMPYEPTGPGTLGARAADGVVPGVPLLLGGLPRHTPRLAELWARALARKPVQDPALAALRQWIDEYADQCPGALDAVRELLVDIARKPGKHRERLLWWLAKWADDRERPSPNSAVLARALERSV